MKKTFAQIMTTIYEAENNLINITNDELKEVFGDLKDKVDNVHAWLGKLEAEKERLAKDIKSLTDRKKAVTNAQDRLKRYIGYTMSNNETPKLYGNSWTIDCRKRDFLIVKKDCEISTMDYGIINSAAGDNVIKREYKIDALKAKKAYQNDPEGPLAKYIETETKDVVRFTANKID